MYHLQLGLFRASVVDPLWPDWATCILDSYQSNLEYHIFGLFGVPSPIVRLVWANRAQIISPLGNSTQGLGSEIKLGLTYSFWTWHPPVNVSWHLGFLLWQKSFALGCPDFCNPSGKFSEAPGHDSSLGFFLTSLVDKVSSKKSPVAFLIHFVLYNLYSTFPFVENIFPTTVAIKMDETQRLGCNAGRRRLCILHPWLRTCKTWSIDQSAALNSNLNIKIWSKCWSIHLSAKL